jgi:hypothetical protein
MEKDDSQYDVYQQAYFKLYPKEKAYFEKHGIHSFAPSTQKLFREEKSEARLSGALTGIFVVGMAKIIPITYDVLYHDSHTHHVSPMTYSVLFAGAFVGLKFQDELASIKCFVGKPKPEDDISYSPLKPSFYSTFVPIVALGTTGIMLNFSNFASSQVGVRDNSDTQKSVIVEAQKPALTSAFVAANDPAMSDFPANTFVTAIQQKEKLKSAF